MTMPRFSARLAATLLVASVALVGSASAALAYWSAGGAATSTVATATLGAPTGVTAAAGSSAVTVSWTAPTVRPPGAKPGYRVVEVSSGAVVCGSGTPVSGTSCSWAPGATGTYRFTVTAVLRTWTATSTPSNQVAYSSATALALTSAAVSGPASTTATLGPLTVALRDAAGHATTAATATTVALASSSAGARFAATPGGTAVTAVTIAAGAGTATFYYGDTRAGSPTVTATATGLTSATQVETITAAAASKLAITSAAVTGAASATATVGPVTVALQDAFGNAATASGATTVTLSSDSAGTAVFAATAGGTPTTTVTVAAGASTATFWYGDTRAGTPTITVTAAGLAGAGQTETVTPAAVATLTFTAQPPATVARNGDFSVTVRALDAFGNAVTTPVTLALNNPGGVSGAGLRGTSSGTTGANGLLTLAGLSVNKAGTYTLTATAAAVTTTSTSFVQN